MTVRRLYEQLTIEWIYNSNALEGSTLTLRETQLILEQGITMGGKSLREHMETVAWAAMAHHKLVAIHPFIDGNGRTARLIMNLIFMRSGYPSAIITRASRQQYYRLLAQADGGKFAPLINFVGRAVARSLMLYTGIGSLYGFYRAVEPYIRLMSTFTTGKTSNGRFLSPRPNTAHSHNCQHSQ